MSQSLPERALSRLINPGGWGGGLVLALSREGQAAERLAEQHPAINEGMRSTLGTSAEQGGRAS